MSGRVSVPRLLPPLEDEEREALSPLRAFRWVRELERDFDALRFLRVRLRLSCDVLAISGPPVLNDTTLLYVLIYFHSRCVGLILPQHFTNETDMSVYEGGVQINGITYKK